MDSAMALTSRVDSFNVIITLGSNFVSTYVGTASILPRPRPKERLILSRCLEQATKG